MRVSISWAAGVSAARTADGMSGRRNGVNHALSAESRVVSERSAPRCISRTPISSCCSISESRPSWLDGKTASVSSPLVSCSSRSARRCEATTQTWPGAPVSPIRSSTAEALKLARAAYVQIKIPAMRCTFILLVRFTSSSPPLVFAAGHSATVAESGRIGPPPLRAPMGPRAGSRRCLETAVRECDVIRCRGGQVGPMLLGIRSTRRGHVRDTPQIPANAQKKGDSA